MKTIGLTLLALTLTVTSAHATYCNGAPETVNGTAVYPNGKTISTLSYGTEYPNGRQTHTLNYGTVYPNDRQIHTMNTGYVYPNGNQSYINGLRGPDGSPIDEGTRVHVSAGGYNHSMTVGHQGKLDNIRISLPTADGTLSFALDPNNGDISDVHLECR